jgi:hypothetical protein
MKKIMGAILGLGLVAPMTAHAETYWLVAQVGERPHREAYVVDSDFIHSDPMKPNAYMARASIIYEAADKPDRVAQLYSVNCDTGMMETITSQLLWRHKRIEQVPNMPLQAPRSFGERQVLKFACAFGAERNAIRAQQAKNAKKSGRKRTSLPSQAQDIAPGGIFATPESLHENGFLILGDTGPIISNFFWEKLWTDGVKPPYTRTMTAEEWAELGRGLAQTGEQLKATQNHALQTVGEGQRRNRRTAYAVDSLETWINGSSDNLQRQWGAPQSSYNAADHQGRYDVLTYKFHTVQQGLNVHGGVVSTQNYTCTVDFHARSGVIFDYFARGNYCKGFLR